MSKKPKKSEKQKIVFRISFGKKKMAITKPRLEGVILIILVVSVAAAQVSGLYPYVYNYSKCTDAPLEVRGGYYRLPSDENYGIHLGSDYSRCYDGPLPKDLQRDPSTKAAIKNAAMKAAQKAKDDARIALISDYIVYKPEGYDISDFMQSDYGDRFESNYRIKTANGREFDVSEMKKGASYDYAQNCHKLPTENWSGTIIGLDSTGREICKTNLSKYVTQYTVGMYIDQTAIIMRAKNASEVLLNDEVIKIFSSMKSARDA